MAGKNGGGDLVLHISIPYSEQLLWEKTFTGETFCESVENMIFAEKTFVNSHKTSKFAKVFSLESFLLLYSMSPLTISTTPLFCVDDFVPTKFLATQYFIVLAIPSAALLRPQTEFCGRLCES